MPDECLIDVSHVSKKFCRSLKHAMWYGVRDIGTELLGRNDPHRELRPGEFWALHDIDLQVRRGECVGLIGPNGSGKSTLLKMLNGLIKPDDGRITIRGRVGGLIALGAGFNPILTGRENVYINSAVLGVSKRDVDRRLDEILQFAEIGDAIDAPVQTYSSGMQVRLGFAVAAILVRPDVLLLDEVLAVGDIGFVIKCLNAVRAIAQNTATVFVSHSMQFVSSFCSRVVVLRDGAMIMDGSVAQGIDCYLTQFPASSVLSGNGQAVIEHVELFSAGANGSDEAHVLRQGENLGCGMRVAIAPNHRGAARVVVYVMDEAMTPIVCCPVVSPDSTELLLHAGTHDLSLQFGGIDFNAGRYCLTVTVLAATNGTCLARLQGAVYFRVLADHTHWAYIIRPATAEPKAKRLPA